MLKGQVVELVKEVLGLGTKKEAEAFLANVDAVVEAVAGKLEVKESAKIGKAVKLAKVEVKAKAGTLKKKDGTVKEWSKPAGVKVKATYIVK